jgi:two-component system, response regulator
MTAAPLILLVEDNPDDQELTLLAFQRGGFSNPIVVAQDGVEALDYLFSSDAGDASAPTETLREPTSLAERPPHQLPTIILLDVQLPRINGLEVLQQIRSHPRTRLIPVIILTTSNEQQDLLTSYELGCNSYIRKPVDYNEFLNVIHQLGLYWLFINTSPILQ